MNPRDAHKLLGCHPDVILGVDRVLTTMAAAGHPMMVTDGFRTVTQQVILWNQGRTTPGPGVTKKRPLGRVVTHADGIRTLSNHQSGRAADCCFIVAGKPSWDEALPWDLYGETAEAVGFSWGGRWPKGKTDKPHIELLEVLAQTA
jgi:peptidoglycan L-alanyl-D-glutamate endopeptidase CwlK